VSLVVRCHRDGYTAWWRVHDTPGLGLCSISSILNDDYDLEHLEEVRTWSSCNVPCDT
jgi:hypothetical protein